MPNGSGTGWNASLDGAPPGDMLLNKEDDFMRSAFDFSPYRRSTIGFDRLFDLLENSASETSENFPPFDLVKIRDDEYRIDLALAGFSSDDLDITAQQNQLVVKGRKASDDGHDYIHRGIALRGFERRFGLADHVQVTGADLDNGILSISLKREIPEAMKPKTIAIGGSEKRSQTKRIEAPSKAESEATEVV